MGFDDEPTCLSVMVLFNTTMFFLTLEVDFHLGEDEEGTETRNIILEIKDVTAFTDSNIIVCQELCQCTDLCHSTTRSHDLPHHILSTLKGQNSQLAHVSGLSHFIPTNKSPNFLLYFCPRENIHLGFQTFLRVACGWFERVLKVVKVRKAHKGLGVCVSKVHEKLKDGSQNCSERVHKCRWGRGGEEGLGVQELQGKVFL